MLREALLWSSENRFLAERLPRLDFVQRAVRRFMPGETPEDAMRAGAHLGKLGIASVLTLLGESATEPAAEVVKHYRRVLEEIHRQSLNTEISVKLTQLGVDAGEEVAASNLESIVSKAEELGLFVWIDIESSGYVDVTLDLYRSARARYEKTGLCLQSYLYRTEEDLNSLLPLDPAIRLVKGAYAEGPDVAFPDKRDVDRNYFGLAEKLLDGVPQVRAAFATHDGRIIRRIKRAAHARGLAKSDVEFQMLYGIEASNQKRLAREGYRVEVLISYGSAWFPWYMRRLAERPANLWFVLRKMVSP